MGIAGGAGESGGGGGSGAGRLVYPAYFPGVGQYLRAVYGPSVQLSLSFSTLFCSEKFYLLTSFYRGII